MSGFEYAFVSEVSQEYCCPICECPMREPVQTKCGHRFCKHCLGQSMKRKRKCPIDRQALDQRSAKDIYPDVAIQRTILDFVVKCPNEHNGCEWTGELRSIETHESSCTYEGVKCSNKGCDASPLKKNLDNHVNHECPKRKVQCCYCKAASFIWCSRQGHFDVCKKYPVDCLQKCGEQISRDKISDHIEKSCPLTQVECTYAHVGCKAKVQRKSITDHLKRNTEWHLKLACEKLQELQSSSTLTTANIQGMQSEVVTAKKKHRELSEIVHKSGDLQDSRYRITLATLSSMQAKVDIVKTKAEKLAGNSEESFSELKDDVNELRILTSRMHTDMGSAMSKTDELSEAVQKSGDLRDSRIQKTASMLFLIESEMDTVKRTLDNLMENYSSSLQSLAGSVSTLDTKLQKLQESNSLRDRKIDRDIHYTKWELQEELKAKLRLVRENAETKRNELAYKLRLTRENAETMRDEFQEKLHHVIENAEENRRKLETFENRWKLFQKLLDGIAFSFVALVCIAYWLHVRSSNNV